MGRTFPWRTIPFNIFSFAVKVPWLIAFFLCCYGISSQAMAPCGFKALAFYTAKEDAAHISFVAEAHKWISEVAEANGFCYDSTNNWNHLNEANLAGYDVVIFLDSRPEDPLQRTAFEIYMRNGGAWLGFHFAAFALSPSAYPDNWDWYQNKFLGCGEYAGNTWRPAAAILKVEDGRHPVTTGLEEKVQSAPNEWYRWKKNLRLNPDIRVLLSIDPSSFPLGTGPRPDEIWHSGYYPVVWTNIKYRMVYFNMGHNDMDYETGTNTALSSSFSSSGQNKLLLAALMWLGR